MIFFGAQVRCRKWKLYPDRADGRDPTRREPHRNRSVSLTSWRPVTEEIYLQLPSTLRKWRGLIEAVVAHRLMAEAHVLRADLPHLVFYLGWAIYITQDPSRKRQPCFTSSAEFAALQHLSPFSDMIHDLALISGAVPIRLSSAIPGCLTTHVTVALREYLLVGHIKDGGILSKTLRCQNSSGSYGPTSPIAVSCSAHPRSVPLHKS